MRKRIQKSMVLVVFVTIMITYGLLTAIVYGRTVHLMEQELRQEADYICEAMGLTGSKYLEELDLVQENTRITWIDEDGNVLYDSVGDEKEIENHSSRPEVQHAEETGSGQDIRKSDTVGMEMYYYAKRMEDGTVLRVSKAYNTAAKSALSLLPVMAILAVVMLLFAWILSKWQVEKLIRPINGLNLEEPLANDMYEELTPLLERIHKQNQEKDAIANMRKEFTANVSHELRTPLTSISGYAEIMMNGLVRTEDMTAFSSRIYKEASRLIRLIEDIIKLSRLDEGKIQQEKEEVNLYELIREICTRLSPQISEKEVHLEISGEEVWYTGIRQILDEMIYNICENAVKYNKQGGSISVWVGNTLNGIKVIVRDTGIGIPKDQQDRIFERFYRVDKSHSKGTGGTGLGLSIVKHGAMLHHASIHVESKLGEGTKMEIIF